MSREEKYEQQYRDDRNVCGDPFPEFAAFFDSYSKERARVLDLGCGQGWDAKHGGLQVGGAIADIRDYEIDGAFDVLILDRVLHMPGRGSQLLVLRRVTQHVAPGGFVLIADMPSRKASFRDVFDAAPAEWEFTLDKKGFLFSRRALSSDMKNVSPRNS